jgi:hypothetical protein
MIPMTPTTPTTPQRPPPPSDHAAQAEQRELLTCWATRYIWWKSLEEALRSPARILTQVMNLGDYEDVQRMVEAFGDAALREVLRHAEAGQLNERSWAYWHYRLGLAMPGHVPPLPTRRFP